MTLRLDARDIPARERADAVRHAIASTIVHVEIDFPQPGAQVTASGVIADLGAMTVCSIDSNATVVQRTRRLAGDDLEPSIFLGLQHSGSSLVVQNGREAVLRPGDLVVYDSTTPYTLVDDDGIRQHFFRVPIAGLALPHNTIKAVSATVLSPGHPVSDLAAAYLERLAARPALFDAPGADAVAQPSIELIRAVISTHLDVRQPLHDSLHATLQLRILEYARAHLGDLDLNAAQVAAEHHISVRHLYKVLADGGITLGDWIRVQRLEGCRHQLGAPGSATVETVARRWGFVNMSSFSRMFREEYGMSPRQWRDVRRGAAQ
jgi:AraC-like DNA-binding protein